MTIQKVCQKQVMMRKYLIITFLSFFVTTVNAQTATTYFPYPEAPESLTTLTERSDYLVTHFWDRCNLDVSFSSLEKMKQAFEDYVSFMPYTTPKVSQESIAKLIKETSKKPANLLSLADIAEETLYGQNAAFWSDELYLPFAKAVVQNKKISKEEKLRYRRHISILEATQEGCVCPDLELTLVDSTKKSLKNFLDTNVVLFFNDPDCLECSLARLQFETDQFIATLVDKNQLRLVSVSPQSADENWRQGVAGYSTDWLVAASDKADDVFDIRMTPCFYLINTEGRIVAKNLGLQQILSLCKQLSAE